ncbi:DoxX family protein [Effusibacillus dendaii]|nr:DoxX family protein [Effusibacillus dendaii]
MMVRWLREAVAASWLLLIGRLWLGYEWLTAGVEKVSDPTWTGNQAGVALTNFLKGALSKGTGAHPEVQGWFMDFLNGAVIPNTKVFTYLVPWGEVLVGIALLTGCLTTFAALAGAFMNTMFLLAGTSSTNPQMLIMAIIIMVAGLNAGKIGLDRYVIPWLRKRIPLLANPKLR